MGPTGNRNVSQTIVYLLMIERCIKKAMRYSDMSMKLLCRQAMIQEHVMDY